MATASHLIANCIASQPMGRRGRCRASAPATEEVRSRDARLIAGQVSSERTLPVVSVGLLGRVSSAVTSDADVDRDVPGHEPRKCGVDDG
jgi:hypothetical protein